MCKNGKHDLRIVYEEEVGYGKSHVVRWCAICGSIVIDIDVDNRTMHPGGILKMVAPYKLSSLIKDYNGVLQNKE